MPRTSFPQVQDYEPRPPALPFSWAQLLWAGLFLLDFTFGLTTKPDSEGHVIRKTKAPGATGRLHRWMYGRLARDLERHLGHLDLSEPKPVPSVDGSDWSPSDFARWRKHANSPLVIKGLLKDSRAVQEWSKDWLVEKHGDARVRCLDRAGIDSSLRGKLWVGENVALRDLSMREFCTEERYEGFYINNYHGLFSAEVFVQDCGGAKLDELRGAERGIEQWFISRSSGSGTPLHSANGDNLFVNVKGSKEWHFIHPGFTPLVLPALSKFGGYAVSELGEFSLDNCEDKCREYPHLKSVPKLICRLEEGDVLYNPPWWWHDVKNRTSFTIGCATRYAGHPTNLRNVPVFHLCQLIDAVKHPGRSVLARTLRVWLFKREADTVIDSIFSGREEERVHAGRVESSNISAEERNATIP